MGCGLRMQNRNACSSRHPRLLVSWKLELLPEGIPRLLADTSGPGAELEFQISGVILKETEVSQRLKNYRIVFFGIWHAPDLERLIPIIAAACHGHPSHRSPFAGDLYASTVVILE